MLGSTHAAPEQTEDTFRTRAARPLPGSGTAWASAVLVTVRFGGALAGLVAAPRLTLELPQGATVEGLYERLAAAHPELAPVLACTLPIVGGSHVEAGRPLAGGEEVALLTPAAGG